MGEMVMGNSKGVNMKSEDVTLSPLSTGKDANKMRVVIE
jgi:hypothetical protein